MINPRGAASGPRRRHQPELTEIAQLSGRITAMKPQQKDPHRRSIYIDGRYVLSLHEESIILARLKVGMDVDGPRLAAALQQDQEKRAWDYALGLLSVSARTRHQLAQRLSSRYAPEVVEPVLDRLTRAGWLDDAAYARHYVEIRRGYGSARLLRDLIKKGVHPDVARQAVAEGTAGEDMLALARDAAAARLKRMPGVDRDTAQRRLAGYLTRRGYDYETISRALEPLLVELPRAARPSRMGSGQRGLRRRWAADEEAEQT